MFAKSSTLESDLSVSDSFQRLLLSHSCQLTRSWWLFLFAHFFVDSLGLVHFGFCDFCKCLRRYLCVDSSRSCDGCAQ